ncbi:hypothetical protein ANCDUO_08326 [Ancylostoma duodenale]|uniref:Flavodoxin-like domain-containing protein n=1 Tax=Ancylostoma duodenale TaxID=51022 RepID=A0A0C2GQP1_9BILA|nr:hypothetical protein ANCDUO_08326 [Ancylostoma duodenale]
MWEWIVSQLDVMDIIILTTLMIGGLYFLVKYRFGEGQSRYTPHISPITPTVKPKDMSFIARMKNENRQVLIMYGSQTGTAEELSGRLAKDFTRYAKKALITDPEEIDVDDMARLSGTTVIAASGHIQRE